MKKIFGRKPVFEALKSGMNVSSVSIMHGAHGDIINKIKQLAGKRGIRISEVSFARFNELDEGNNTQGVIALISEHKFYSLHEIIDHAKKSPRPFLLLLDSIQDPHNLGAILRTAECSGVHGVVITTHNSAQVNDTVEKTSAGAVSHLKMCMVGNLNNAMKEIKDAGFWITGTSLDTDKNYTDVDYTTPTAIVMGNEEKGIRKLVSENCDFLVRIPMSGKIQSLNVSVATGVLLFEVMRQRAAN